MTKNILFSCFILIAAGIVGLGGGLAGAFIMLRVNSAVPGANIINEPARVVKEESAIIDVVEKAQDAVVSIIITRELPNIERYYDFNNFRSVPDTTPTQIGAGSGFLVSADGYVVTNRHVVDTTDADYTVILNNGEKVAAKVLARDTVLDIAVLKIERQGLPFLSAADSDQVKVGQHVVAIGYALGEFQNSVTSGIISGKLRTITASDGQGAREQLENIFQTDASINPGNSGGPLLDYNANVVGVNVAVSQNAENIGFAIPINDVKRIIEDVIQFGEIRRPYIGVRYINITPELANTQDLDVDYGALLSGNSGQPAIIPNSPAAKAGLKENDIILEINGEKVESNLQRLVQKYKIGEKVTLKVLSGGDEKTVELTLEQLKQ